MPNGPWFTPQVNLFSPGIQQAEDYLPNRVVNILVGMFSWIDSASYLYEGDEAAAIKRAAMDVETLIFQHVVPAR